MDLMLFVSSSIVFVKPSLSAITLLTAVTANKKANGNELHAPFIPAM